MAIHYNNLLKTLVNGIQTTTESKQRSKISANKLLLSQAQLIMNALCKNWQPDKTTQMACQQIIRYFIIKKLTCRNYVLES